jgi:hypothetical protein
MATIAFVTGNFEYMIGIHTSNIYSNFPEILLKMVKILYRLRKLFIWANTPLAVAT